MTVMVVTVQQVHHSVILVIQDVLIQPNKMTKKKKTKAKKKKKTKNEMQTKEKEKMKITDSSGENGVKDVNNEIEYGKIRPFACDFYIQQTRDESQQVVAEFNNKILSSLKNEVLLLFSVLKCHRIRGCLFTPTVEIK